VTGFDYVASIGLVVTVVVAGWLQWRLTRLN
jgi:hypothetical protein